MSTRWAPMTGLYVPGPVTAGRELYERWLWLQWVPPDDLWDHLDEEERRAWERLASERSSQGTEPDA